MGHRKGHFVGSLLFVQKGQAQGRAKKIMMTHSDIFIKKDGRRLGAWRRADDWRSFQSLISSNFGHRASDTVSDVYWWKQVRLYGRLPC
jgi:hypothetical protein